MNSDSPMEMDAALAAQLFAQGAVLIIAGVPVGHEFGIDLCSYTLAENFRGVKMIPAGVHFVWCASKGREGDVAPRVGFVHCFKPNEIVVKEWDSENEELRERKIANPELEKQRIRENLKQLDAYLAAYDFRHIAEWNNLTDTVTEATVIRCRPAKGSIRSNVELQSCPDSERPRGTSKTVINQFLTDDNDLLPKLKPVAGTAPTFTTLPSRVPKNLTPTKISEHCMDCIEAVHRLMSAAASTNEIIEEIQLSYVFFLVGYSLESLEHWRKMLDLLAHSELAVEKYKLFFMKYSELLAHQLPHLPEELMVPTERNTVYKDVRRLLVNLTLGGLTVSAERLTGKLLNKMNWQFEGLLDDDPEDMPVVVETI